MMWYFGFRLPLPHRKFLEIDSIQSRFGSLWLGISFYNFFLYNTTRNKRGRAGKLQNHPHFISIRLCVLVAYFLFFHLFFSRRIHFSTALFLLCIELCHFSSVELSPSLRLTHSVPTWNNLTQL